MHDTRHIFSTSLSNISSLSSSLTWNFATWALKTTHMYILPPFGGFFPVCSYIDTDSCLHLTCEIVFILLRFPTPVSCLYNHLLHSLKANFPACTIKHWKELKKNCLCSSLRAKPSFITPKFIRTWEHQVTPLKFSAQPNLNFYYSWQWITLMFSFFYSFTLGFL